jgi:hypothetical protein
MNITPILKERFEALLYAGCERVCPSCSEKLYPGACKIVSPPDNQVSLKPTVLEAEPTGILRPFSILFPKPLDGERFTRSRAARLCPRCGYLLPYNIERARKITIAIIGDVSSGKSLYIAVLLHLLEQALFVRRHQQFKFACLTPEARERYENEYGRPLFQNYRVPQPNPRAANTTHQPLIYEVALRDAPDLPVEYFNLLFYDTSGEDYVIESRQVRYASYLFQADAIMFMLDPLSVPAIRQHLPQNPALRYGTVSTPGHPLDSFSKIIQPLSREGMSRSFRKRPLAIVLSKADVLKKVRPGGQQYSFLSHAPDHRNGLDLADIQRVDEEVRCLLADCDLERFMETVAFHQPSLFSSVLYSAVSAIGQTPDANGQVTAITPLRCLDPFLWALHHLGLVRAATSAAHP